MLLRYSFPWQTFQMNFLIENAGLEDIAQAVSEGKRLSPEQGLRLYECKNLNAVGFLANIVRERKNGNRATYILNRYINYSNVCILNCQFCAFYRRQNQEGAFTFSVDEIISEARKSYESGMREVHIVGGLHPKLPYSYYIDMVSGIKAACPEMFVKAFTAIEIRHLADRVARSSIISVLTDLKKAGLDSLTGGGAEIFDPEIRDQICRGKESAEEWLEVHQLWHEMGGRSTATMLYGHLEAPRHRIDHLLRLRDLQDKTGGFTAFIPFAFEPENNALSTLKRVSAHEDLHNIAVARLFLDNIDHITAYWISLGLPLAQIALSFGVDDLHGTIQEERIFHMAGAKTPQEQTAAKMEKIIREAGREPALRNTWYEVIS